MFKLVVLFAVIALATAEPSLVAPLWGGHLAAPWAAAVAAPIAAPLALAAHGVPNYRGPLSLAPGQPANILAVDGRPLDTLSVNVDRIVHATAKAVDHAGILGAHLLKKRSIVGAPLVAPGVWPGVAAAHIAAPVVAAAPVAAVGWGHAAHWGHAW